MKIQAFIDPFEALITLWNLGFICDTDLSESGFQNFRNWKRLFMQRMGYSQDRIAQAMGENQSTTSRSLENANKKYELEDRASGIPVFIDKDKLHKETDSEDKFYLPKLFLEWMDKSKKEPDNEQGKEEGWI